MFQVLSCVRGHHIYKSVWNPSAGEELAYLQETAAGQTVKIHMLSLSTLWYVEAQLLAMSPRRYQLYVHLS